MTEPTLTPIPQQPTPKTSRRPRVSQVVTVEAEVDLGDFLSEADDEQLLDLGLHRDDNCGEALADDQDELYVALSALHQQAHTDQPIHIDACLREPCRNISLRTHPQISTTY